MYGLVNKGIRDLVVQSFGPEAWQRIATLAGCEGAEFLSMEPYEDRLTYRLVEAGSEQLGKAPAELLEAFGEFWITYTAAEGYGELMDLFGSSLEEFLDNLDAMHMRIGLTMPELKPPSFSFERRADGEDRLHYRSDRPGLVPMVAGLLRGLARRFQTTCSVRHLPEESTPGHDVFLIVRST